MSLFKIYNGPAPTTAEQASVATGTSLKTMLQIKAGTKGLRLTGWGFSLDTAQAAAGTVELLKTDVAATVTASVIGDIVALGTPSTASTLSLGITATGYTSTNEGVVADTDVFDAIKLSVSTTASPTSLYVCRFPERERPFLPAGKILRVRAHAGTSAGMIAWVSWLER